MSPTTSGRRTEIRSCPRRLPTSAMSPLPRPGGMGARRARMRAGTQTLAPCQDPMTTRTTSGSGTSAVGARPRPRPPWFPLSGQHARLAGNRSGASQVLARRSDLSGRPARRSDQRRRPDPRRRPAARRRPLARRDQRRATWIQATSNASTQILATGRLAGSSPATGRLAGSVPATGRLAGWFLAMSSLAPRILALSYPAGPIQASNEFRAVPTGQLAARISRRQ